MSTIPENSIAFDPKSHPDFLLCDDPRLKVKRERPVVYVPNLVYLVHRLGGPHNIATFDDREREDTELRIGHTLIVKASIWKHHTDGAWTLHLDDWHRTEKLLTIVFRVPPKWHLGEWAVEHVGIMDTMSASADLDRQAAEHCDRYIGMSLADPSV
jgi:hypothetical protein